MRLKRGGFDFAAAVAQLRNVLCSSWSPFLGIAVAVCIAGCGASLQQHAALAGTIDSGTRARLARTLEQLESLSESGQLAMLRSGVCDTAPRNQKTECAVAWGTLRDIRQSRDALASTSRNPRILEPIHAAVRALSPDPGHGDCSAALTASVRGQAAVVAWDLEFVVQPVVAVAATVSAAEVGCLEVPTLGGHVHVISERAREADIRLGAPQDFVAAEGLAAATPAAVISAAAAPAQAQTSEATTYDFEDDLIRVGPEVPDPRQVPYRYSRAMWLELAEVGVHGANLYEVVIAYASGVWRVVARHETAVACFYR